MSRAPSLQYTGLPRAIALFVFVFMAFAPPVTLWYAGNIRAAETLKTEARMLSVTVSRVIGRQPEYWNLTPERLAFIIRDVMPQGRFLTVADRNTTILSLGEPPENPVISSTQDLFDRDDAVGVLTLQGSLRVLLVDTIATALLSLSCSLIITILLWRNVLWVMRQTALQVEESREQFQKLTELSNDGYWAMDAGLRFTTLSSGMDKIGLGMDTAGGRALAELAFTQKSESFERLSREIENREVFHREQVSLESGEQTHWILLSGEPLFDGASRFLGYQGTATDVTEHVRMQEALVQSEKLASVGQLAAGMAHEINNPLGGVLQSIQVIQRRLDFARQANLDAADRVGCSLNMIRAYLEDRNIMDMLDNINQSGKRAAKIVSTMLEFSRKSTEYKTQEDMLKILDDALELSGKYFRQDGEHAFKNVEIVKEYREDSILVFGSKTELEQVLVNIMKNAIQAMYGKSYGEDRPRLVLRAFQRDGNAFIEIEDNGPGMDAAVKNHIFDPFYTTKQPGQGTGLGLSVSYYIITHNHMGSIEVDSTPGKGTTFTIRVPLTQD